jgi:CRISPR-associated protein Cas5 subtype I-B
MNKVILFNTKSALGSFLRPQSNNNNSTFAIMPKSALIGMICAVVGIERKIMIENNYYKLFSEKIKYTIKLNSPFNIKCWSEYAYNHRNAKDSGCNNVYTPNKFERLVDINYSIAILYDDSDEDIRNILNEFIFYSKEKRYVFNPYMGMANFPADIEFIGEYSVQENFGDFKTEYFIINPDKILDNESEISHIKPESIPTKSISYLGFDPDSYTTIFFHDNCGSLNSTGTYYSFNNIDAMFI